MNIAIVENSLIDQKKLSELIDKYFGEHNATYKIEMFNNGYDFLESTKAFDVVFMDIEMPGIDGMTTAFKIREKDKDIAIVFVTNMAQFAIDGYKVKAIDFCLKPIIYPDLKIILDGLVKKVDDTNNLYFIFKRNGELLKIKQSDVEAIEMFGHTANITYYHGAELKETSIRTSMKELTMDVKYHGLVSISSGSLINLKYFSSYDMKNSLCYLKSGKHLIVSRSHKKEFLLSISRF